MSGRRVLCRAALVAAVVVTSGALSVSAEEARVGVRLRTGEVYRAARVMYEQGLLAAELPYGHLRFSRDQLLYVWWGSEEVAAEDLSRLVVLSDGSRLTGEVEKITADMVLVRLPYGTLVVTDLGRVRSVGFARVDRMAPSVSNVLQFYLADGTVVSGELTRVDGKEAVIQLPYGQLRVPRGEIVRIQGRSPTEGVEAGWVVFTNGDRAQATLADLGDDGWVFDLEGARLFVDRPQAILVAVTSQEGEEGAPTAPAFASPRLPAAGWQPSQQVSTARRFGVLRGRVFDALTARPVPRARLRLTAYGMTAVADDLGVYVFTGVPVGATTLIVSAPGYRDYVQNIQVLGGEQTLDVVLHSVAAWDLPPAAPQQRRVSAEWPAAGGGVYVTAGYASMSPAEFNARIDDLNDVLTYTRDRATAAGFTATLDPLERIEQGWWGEGGIRLAGPPVVLSVGVQYLKPGDATSRLDIQGADVLTYDSGWKYDYTYTSSTSYSSYYGYYYTVTDYYNREQTYRSGSSSVSMRITSSVLGPVGQVGLVLGRRPAILSLLASAGYFWLAAEMGFTSSDHWTDETVTTRKYEVYYYCSSSYYGFYDYCDYDSSTYTTGSSYSTSSSSDSYSLRVRSEAIGWEGRAVLSLLLSDHAALEASVGYQSLRFERLRDEETGQALKDGNGAYLPLDLSGIRAGVGLALRF